MCTREDGLTHNLGEQCIDGVMSYNLLTTDGTETFLNNKIENPHIFTLSGMLILHVPPEFLLANK